jgi:hypothetical protein
MSATKAARLYAVYLEALGDDAKGLPAFMDRPDKGRPWFAVANAIDAVLEPPVTREPFDFDLSVPIPKRRVSELRGEGGAPDDNDILIENLPTSLHIRPIVGGDLCCREFSSGFDIAVRSKIHGVEADMLEWRVDPSDADAANYLLYDVTGEDAWHKAKDIYLEAGGEDLGESAIVWQSVAGALLCEEFDGYFLVRCRTAGLGAVQIGPVRLGHLRIYEDAASELTEWDGRFAALSAMTKKPVDQLKAARVEDLDRMWGCLMSLKKKAAERAMFLFAARASLPSTAGPTLTSSDSPSES